LDCTILKGRGHCSITLLALFFKTLLVSGLLYADPVALQDPILEGATPLHLAAMNGDLGETKRLLSAGFQVSDTLPISGATPLHAATIGAETEIVKLLLEHGADPNSRLWEVLEDNELRARGFSKREIAQQKKQRDEEYDESNIGRTPIFFAVQNENLDLVRLLTAAGSEVNIPSEPARANYPSSTTPIQLAVRNDNLKIAEALLQAGADINSTDALGNTPLFYAGLYSSPELIRVVLENEPALDHQNFRGQSPLHFVVNQFRAVEPKMPLDYTDTRHQFIEDLVRLGADLELTDAAGLTPVMISALNNDVETLVKLLSLGASSTLLATNTFRGSISEPIIVRVIETPVVFWKILGGNHSAVEAILQQEPNRAIQARDWLGRNILGVSAYVDDTRLVRQILTLAGRQLLSNSQPSDTHPLILALKSDHDKMAAYLLDWINKQNNPLDLLPPDLFRIVFQSRHRPDELTRLLIRGGVDINFTDHDGHTPLHLAFLSGQPRGTIEFLLASSPDLNARNRWGSTILHSALSNPGSYHHQLFLRILRRVDQPSYQDSEGLTPLFLAIEQGNLEAVQALIANGSELNITNLHGETPLVAAVRRRSIEIVTALLDGGADRTVTDQSGRNIIELAEEYSGSEMIEYLKNLWESPDIEETELTPGDQMVNP